MPDAPPGNISMSACTDLGMVRYTWSKWFEDTEEDTTQFKEIPKTNLRIPSSLILNLFLNLFKIHNSREMLSDPMMKSSTYTANKDTIYHSPQEHMCKDPLTKV